MKTKALISCAVTAQLICAFVFAKAKVRFSHDVAQILLHILIILHFMQTLGVHLPEVDHVYVRLVHRLDVSLSGVDPEWRGSVDACY